MRRVGWGSRCAVDDEVVVILLFSFGCWVFLRLVGILGLGFVVSLGLAGCVFFG